MQPILVKKLLKYYRTLDTLNLPPFEPRLRKLDEVDHDEIWDSQRRRWVKLTPEEWVRQHFVHYMTVTLQYPAGRVGNEVAIKVANLERRCDTVVFGNNGEPVMIVEYKAPSVTLTQQVFDQIARYNAALQVDWLVVSNGRQHYCCHLDHQQHRWVFLQGLPGYQELIQPLQQQ